MSLRLAAFRSLIVLGVLVSCCQGEEPRYEAELVFPPRKDHNHAPGIVECPNGDLLVSWYRGSGERSADDVAVYGSRRRKGTSDWNEAFLMADTPQFPDCNTAMHLDANGKLWLFWPLILDNTWDTCLTHFRTSTDYSGDGCPKWQWQGVIPLVPKDFVEKMTTTLDGMEAELKNLGPREKGFAEMVRQTLKKKISHRLGWQPRCKPTVLPSGRMLLPLYTDTYSVCVMAITDDGGQTWYASQPLVGYGNIQAAVLRRNDGTLVAYMRENGPRDKVRVCESADDGITWGPVGVCELPNPGSGLDGVRLANGRWLLVYNDSIKGRNTLALSLSDDEGKTWKWTRHLEKHDSGSFHYPAIIQGADGTIHCVYSHFVNEEKTMKHAAVNEAWIMAGDG